ncbi:MAG: asparagine synthase (glutamine-hydrolyzing) [Pseudomonadales bacterium]|nr:asparagine synthase (glutamine-hydrolyzing) [Pseudomonadales bacterium]
MCGIVGIARASGLGRIGLENVRTMADAIIHRGPDDQGFHAAEHAIIGMRRLSIIDLAGGHQPIANEDDTVWVVCNGEIYNFRGLRADLERRGHRFRTLSDTEVVVHLYEEYGDSFVEYLSGMYAIALWDATRRRLILVRDRLGQKPLYIAEKDGYLAFASEVKALLTLPLLRAGIDRSALGEYLSLGYCTAPRTLFAGIRKLPPAARLVWENGSARSERYWALPDSVDQSVPADDWARQVRRELERSVDEHLVSDVPLGAFLSGGLDSSAIVGLMAQRIAGPVNTYSIGYGGDGAAAHYNELSFAAEVAKRFATRHTEILVSPDLAVLMPKLLWHLEEPISDGAAVTTYLVSQLARKSVTVILSGVGGDELFAGYPRYLGAHYGRRYRMIPRWLRRGVLQPLAGVLPSGRQNRLMDLSRYAKRFVQAGELDWRQQYRSYLEIASSARVGHLLGSDYLADDGFAATVAEERADDELLRLMRVDAQTQLAEDLLLLTDKITMAESLECRVPFLDHRLVELAARIPARHKLAAGEFKTVLKRAVHDLVPASIIGRGKRGFGAPFGQWFKRELKPLRDQLVNRATVESRGLLRWDAVAESLALHDANREDYTDLLLVLVNLELWCRLFLDGTSVGDLGEELAIGLREAHAS